MLDSLSDLQQARANNSTILLRDPIFAATHNAFLLGCSIIELKSRVQMNACELALDSITLEKAPSQEGASGKDLLEKYQAEKDAMLNAFILNLSAPPDKDSNRQPDLIDALLRDTVLKGLVEPDAFKARLVPREVPSQESSSEHTESMAEGAQLLIRPKALNAFSQSLPSDLRDNEWNTSVFREAFGRIVRLHRQRFPQSDTRGTFYDVNLDQEPFPYSYLFPGKNSTNKDAFDYTDVGVRKIGEGYKVTGGSQQAGGDNGQVFDTYFSLYDVARRTLNCLTLLLITPEENLFPTTIEEYQRRLVPKVLQAPCVTSDPQASSISAASQASVTTSPTLATLATLAPLDQSVFAEPANLPKPSDQQIKAAIKMLSNVLIRLLDAWDSFLRESFYSDAVAPTPDFSSILSPEDNIELCAYEAGRALAALTWSVSAALVPVENKFTQNVMMAYDQQRATSSPTLKEKLAQKAQATWLNVFNERDVDNVQYQITALSTALDDAYYRVNRGIKRPGSNDATVTPDFNLPSQGLRAVKQSLDYWQQAIVRMCQYPLSDSAINDNGSAMTKPLLAPLPASVSPQVPALSPSVKGSGLHWDASKTLRSELIQQSSVWQSLILSQQNLSSFDTGPVTRRLVNDFMQELEKIAGDVAQELLRTRTFTFIVIGVVVLLVLIIVGVALANGLSLSAATGPMAIFIAISGAIVAGVQTFFGRVGRSGGLAGLFGPFSTTLVGSFEHGLERIKIEFEGLDHQIAITYPLIEFFGLEKGHEMLYRLEGQGPSPQPSSLSGIKDGYDFLIHVIWTDEERAEELQRVAQAAFGPISTFLVSYWQNRSRMTNRGVSSGGHHNVATL